MLQKLFRADVVQLERNLEVMPKRQGKNGGRAVTKAQCPVRSEGGAELRYCKLHTTGDKGNFVPLDQDPVLLGLVDGLNTTALKNVLEGTALGKVVKSTEEVRKKNIQARAAGTAMTTAPAAVAEREGRKRSREHGIPEGSPPSAVRKIHELSEAVDDLRAKLNATTKELEAARLQIDHSIPTLSYASLVGDGEMEAAIHRFSPYASRRFTRLPPLKLKAIVDLAEIVGGHKAWKAGLKANPDRRKILETFGFRNAVALTLFRCASGLPGAIVAWAFGLDEAKRRCEGRRAADDCFFVTLKIINRVYAGTIAQPPKVKQLDADRLPAFRNPLFANFIVTADATNVVLGFKPNNPVGLKHTYSDYYKDNCGKIEMVSTSDGLSAWISLTGGGSSSEEKLMRLEQGEGEGLPHVSFKTWFAKVMAGCVDEDNKKFKPGMLADKGTRILKLMEEVGADYLTPQTHGEGNAVTYQEINENEQISRARGHVERVIGHMKRFKIISTGIPHKMVHLIDEIVYFCCFTPHFF